MQKSTKLFLAGATLWPFVYVIFFMLFIVASILFAQTAGSGFQALFLVVFVLHALTMLLILGLTIFYIVDVFRNERVEKDKKVLWAVVIFLGSMIAMPIYWYLYIWKEPAVAGHSFPGRLNSMDNSAWTNDVRSSREREDQYVPPSRPPDWR